MDVMDFVEAKFGAPHAKKLRNIGVGANNNKKGGDFENYFATAKICTIASQVALSDLDDYQISSQEVAYVDDICVRRLSTAEKTNYQAKNSSGAAANWDDEMQDRFDLQRQIDVEFHQSRSSTQILLVSCPDKAAANDAKIPSEMKTYCISEYFPYFSSVPKLMDGHAQLREVMETLCGTKSWSSIDAAFRLVLGEWCGENDQGRTVGNVMARAKANSRPDLFAGLLNGRIMMTVELEGVSIAGPVAKELEAPAWLVEKLAAFQRATITVESRAFIVDYNGMQARVASDTPTPAPEILDNLKTPGDIILFLMSLAEDGLDDQSPIGDDQQ